jgi:hypothetical protein
MDFLPGVDISLRVLFEAQGQPKVPDNGSVKYTLYDDAGAAIDTDVALAPAAAANYVVVPVVAAKNAITQRYEKRTLVVKYTVNGAGYTSVVRYRLVPLLNIETGPDDVRRALGVGSEELGDDEIDIASSYFAVEDEATQSTLEAALAGVPADRKAANDAILYSTVLDCLPSLSLRVAQSQEDGALKFSRFSKGPDFAEIRQDAQDRLSAAMSALTGRTDSDFSSFFIGVSTPSPDVITGA